MNNTSNQEIIQSRDTIHPSLNYDSLEQEIIEQTKKQVNECILQVDNYYSISQLANIDSISLRINQKANEHLKISKNLEHFINLKQLNLFIYHLEFEHQHFIDFIQGLSFLNNLVELRINFFEKNQQWYQGIEDLFIAFKSLSKLKQILLQIDNSSFIYLYKHLTHLLITLPFSTSNVNIIKHLGKTLLDQQQITQIYLDILRCKDFTHQGIKHLSQGIMSLHQLENMKLRIGEYVYLGSKGYSYLGQIFQHINNLQSLEINIQNNLEQEDASFIVQGLKQQHHLKYLHLFIKINNTVDTQGMKLIMSEIGDLKGLVDLNLTIELGNKIEEIGIQFINQALSKQIHLTDLNLKVNYNRINGYNEWKYFGDGLRYLTNLNKCYIQIGGEGDNDNDEDELNDNNDDDICNEIDSFIIIKQQLEQLQNLKTLALYLPNNQQFEMLDLIQKIKSLLSFNEYQLEFKRKKDKSEIISLQINIIFILKNITFIEEVFCNFQNLLSIEIQFYQIIKGNEALIILQQGLSKLKNLTSLDIRINENTFLFREASSFVDSLSNLNLLQDLTLNLVVDFTKNDNSRSTDHQWKLITQSDNQNYSAQHNLIINSQFEEENDSFVSDDQKSNQFSLQQGYNNYKSNLILTNTYKEQNDYDLIKQGRIDDYGNHIQQSQDFNEQINNYNTIRIDNDSQFFNSINEQGILNQHNLINTDNNKEQNIQFDNNQNKQTDNVIQDEDNLVQKYCNQLTQPSVKIKNNIQKDSKSNNFVNHKQVRTTTYLTQKEKIINFSNCFIRIKSIRSLITFFGIKTNDIQQILIRKHKRLVILEKLEQDSSFNDSSELDYL